MEPMTVKALLEATGGQLLQGQTDLEATVT